VSLSDPLPETLLMIPGPIEVSPAVAEASSGAPEAHLAPDIIAAHSRALKAMRKVWCASKDHQPFAIAGSGTLAMEMAVTNLLQPGDAAIVVNSGFFSDRMAEMLVRRGVEVTQVTAAPGDAPELDEVEQVAAKGGFKAMFATHVDTSTGVRVDAEALCAIANRHDLLSVFDGVCATGGERFEMAEWGADVYLTSSQKAIGLPAGLALLVVSPSALSAREALTTPPPMSIDFQQWLPIMRAYEAGEKSYFSTPATTLIKALDVSLAELLGKEGNMEACFTRHERAAIGMRRAWQSMGLDLLPSSKNIAANTLSAVRYPRGIDPSLVQRIVDKGIIVAGGLHPDVKDEYFRVGHMGYSTSRPDHLISTIRAVGQALNEAGHPTDVHDAIEAVRRAL
jgi:alanine-glyoxylate transaminase / serine-glyoxylate transaminase / serine-pyruvate transaminase